MRRLSVKGLFFFIALFVSVVFASIYASQTAFAGGGIGPGGSGSGGTGGGPWGWTTYGHGWAEYSSSGPGPSASFHTGDWGAISATCRGQNAGTVIVYILGTGTAPPGNSPTGNYKGYNYQGWSGAWGRDGSVDNGRANKIGVVDATWAFNNLGTYGVSTAGYTFGSNVGWFCWNFNPDAAPNFDFDMNCSVVRGYAFDTDGMATKLQVHVYVGGPAGTPGAVATAVFANIDDGDTSVINGQSVQGHIFRVDLTQEPFKSKVANSAQPVYVYTWSYNAAGTLIAGPYVDNTTPYGKTTVGPCNQATCNNGSSGLPANMSVGQAYYLQPQADLSSTWGSPMYTGATGSDYNPKMHYTIRRSIDGGNSWPTIIDDQDVKYDAGFPTAGSHITANPTGAQGDRGIKFIPTLPGWYAIAWTLTGSGAVSSINTGICGSTGSVSNVPDQGTAGTQPYFQIIGGDIIAGGKVNGYNQNGLNINADPDTTAYAGAGTTLAAIVGGTSANFVTGSLLNTGVSTKSGGGLGFSNVSLATNETAKGFVPLPSTPTVDLSGAHTNWASVGNLSTCTAKCVYDVAPGTTIAGTVSAGADITLYAATGNIYLGNITYNYGSLDTIPRLTVYTAAGNIIVANTTTELHGVFIAAGGAADTSKGRFYSCGTGVNTPITYTTVTNQCGTALTVYGAVIADKLVLARTSGTYIPGQPNSNPAEKFVFGPEVWLHHSTTTTSGGSTAPVFDQYFSLPPVL